MCPGQETRAVTNKVDAKLQVGHARLRARILAAVIAQVRTAVRPCVASDKPDECIMQFLNLWSNAQLWDLSLGAAL